MRWNRLILFGALSGAGVAVYAGLSALAGSTGFPLDDAWIHQTYARNFAESGQLAFIPGQPSAGSTAPLWTLLIAAGYKLNVDYRLWTYALGVVALALCGGGLAALSLRLWPERPRLALAAGLLCVFEWHLAWAAASGMETLLFAALGLALMNRAAAPTTAGRDGLVFGVLSGLLVLTRPEGLLLVALAGLARLAQPNAQPRPRFALTALAGLGVCLFPAVWLNLQASGTLFPNTFYAKQQEYAVYFSSFTTWLPRALDVIGAPFVGATVLLAPGFLYQAVACLRAGRDRSTWLRALPIVWMAAHLAVYAARLPVTYQHGRYVMPVVPVIVLYGLQGSAALGVRLRQVRSGRLLGRVGAGALIGLAVAFWMVGAGAYRLDVNIIERELVASAQWLAAHTPPDALIAAHDIGAIGYFARRPLLDLAGLVSPEVIPIIRDEARLLALMRARGVDFFAAPPDFYSVLPAAPEWQPVFAGDSPFAPKHWSVFRASGLAP